MKEITIAVSKKTAKRLRQFLETELHRRGESNDRLRVQPRKSQKEKCLILKVLPAIVSALGPFVPPE